jgi:phthiocerol/phenolphthiocerol synthesis type-I polyketide synthase D
VWSAKATGAWRLHLATADHDLDWWVAYSSLAAVLGSAGQANYAAANAHVDAIVRWRRANQLPATSVNWGPVAEVGKVRDARFTGMDPLRPAQVLAALEELITRDRPQTVVARLRPDELLGALPHTAESSFFDPIRPADLCQREDTVADQVRLRVCQVMGFAREKLPADTPLVHLGLDSLAATRIKNALLEDFDVDLPVARLLQGASLLDLTSDLTNQITPAPAAEHRSAPAERAVERARLRMRLTAKRRRAGE